MQAHRQSDATRKRFKALAHLPTATKFALAELDVTALVSAATLQHFGDELRRRSQARTQRKDAP